MSMLIVVQCSPSCVYLD